MYNKIHDKTILKINRKYLRNNATSAEAFLWKFIQSGKLCGRKFRRQHSIENYIVDFYCSKEKLIIELEGSVHNNVGVQVADEIRDTRLLYLGF